MNPKELTCLTIQARSCGDHLRRLFSKAQKFVLVKGETEGRTFRLQGKRATMRTGQDKG